MRARVNKSDIGVYTLLMLAVIAQIGVWLALRHEQAEWANVPPAPSAQGAQMGMLGDPQLAYRATGIMLQNMGDHGGRVVALADYNYHRLARWFRIQHELDERSNFTPFLAAFYYGANPDTSDLYPLIDYLAMVGESPYSNKWRWLAQAVYLARFRQNDLESAQRLAYKLADMYRHGMPAWVVQMPTFILAQRGQQEAAYDLAVQLLRDEGENMHPNEVMFMRDYICTRILTEAQAAINPLCEGID